MINVIPHVGRKKNGEEVVLDQFQIMVNGVRVGYCGRKPGMPISLIKQVDDATKQQISEAVKKAIKGEPGKVATTSPLTPAAKKHIESLSK